MEDDGGKRRVVERSLEIPRSESKKRGIEGMEEKSELGHKRVKMRDLESVFRSEGIDTHYPRSRDSGEAANHYNADDTEVSQVTRETTTLNYNAAQSGRTGANVSCRGVDGAPSIIDLNARASVLVTDAAAAACFDAKKKLSMPGKPRMESETSFEKSRGLDLDLNAEDVTSAVNNDPFLPYKSFEHLKSQDALSECASTCGTVEDKDPMRVWKEMKQNGFLSSSHGGVPMPKPRGRKSKTDGIKKKIEIAKREQVNRFAKIAAPSGLLNGLNPGIINHVRNRKQVHSIIEALVRSERHENRASSKQGNQINGDESGTNRFDICHEDGSHDTLSGSRHISTSPVDDHTRYDDSGMTERQMFCNIASPAYPDIERNNDILALKLSSSATMASENRSSVSNETSVNSLSFKAANVAAQWLELLFQDIKGRLSALRRSKKRVQAVIQTELPLLMSKELSSNQEYDPYAARHSDICCSGNATAELHRAKWNALFDQMDKALSEEENQLESSLNQIREMLLHCERGLLQCRSVNGLQLLATLESDGRFPKADTADKELAVRAAAASIYSTCNFLQSMENLPCF